MTPEQWFTLWMTVLQTIGGGAVTLGGVGAGFLFARHSDRQKRWQEDITFWIDKLSTVDRDIMHAEPETQEQAAETQRKALFDLLYLLKSRPGPRNSIADLVNMSISCGIFGGALSAAKASVAEMTSQQMEQAARAVHEGRAEANIDYRAGLSLIRRVLVDTVELLQSWRDKGVSQKKIDRALELRMSQLGFTRVPDHRRTGPSSDQGGWV